MDTLNEDFSEFARLLEEAGVKYMIVPIEIGSEPRKIQVLTGIDGVKFEQAWQNRVEVNMNGMNLQFIGKADLIANKRAVGRPKDQIDLLELEKL